METIVAEKMRNRINIESQLKLTKKLPENIAGVMLVYLDESL